MPKPNHILVLRFSSMGDVAIAIPVLRTLLEQYPKLRITVVTRKKFQPLFNQISDINVYSVDFSGRHKGIFGLCRLANQLKRLKFNAVADLHNVLRTKILNVFFFNSNIEQIKKGRAEKKALITGKTFRPLKTTYQRYADVFEKLGYKIDLSQPIFPQKAVLKESLKKYISNKELPLIGIAPFAAYKGKMYPLNQMKKVIEALSKNNNIILFGGGELEIETLHNFENKFKNIKNAATLKLQEQLHLMSHLNIMLSMDSANGHLAAMLGVRVITIWGVTHPFAGFAPFNQPEEFALLADKSRYPLIPTSVYGNTYPKAYEMAAGSIAAETVVDKILKTIAEK